MSVPQYPLVRARDPRLHALFATGNIVSKTAAGHEVAFIVADVGQTVTVGRTVIAAAAEV